MRNGGGFRRRGTRSSRACRLPIGSNAAPVLPLPDPRAAARRSNGAAPDTRLNAQRKAYTAARSDARTTEQLADKVRDNPVERASFDPFFTFFLGGVGAFEGGRKVGAVGVSGLPGKDDAALAASAIEAAGLSLAPA